jgi:hypothetical protein
MTQATVASDVQETLDVHLDLGAQLAFHLELIVDDVPDGRLLFVIPLVHLLIIRDLRLVQDVLGSRPTDPIYIGQANFASFVLG